MPSLENRTIIGVTSDSLDQWHHSPGALRRLSPPWDRVEVVQEPPAIENGALVKLRVKAGPAWTRWTVEHFDCRRGHGFSDRQLEGPFADWTHNHIFNNLGDGRCELVDQIDYKLPLGFLGRLVGGGFVRRKLERTFVYRHVLNKMDLERMHTEPATPVEGQTVLVTGATGLVGRALEAYLQMRGFRILRVTRNPTRKDDILWDIGAQVLELPADVTVHAVVHLAGENVAGGRWTADRKKRILESRRLGTRLVCQTLAARDQKPAVLVSASGANYYQAGTGDELDESAPAGSSFLSDVTKVWEGETRWASDAGIRVVGLRLGVVLSPAGGALAKMLPAFRAGLGGRIGSGKQMMSWIALDDVVDIIHRAICDDRYDGAINTVSPRPVSNADFTKELGRALRRPTVATVPAAALKIGFGAEFAEETLLADLAVVPGKLNSLNYPFRYPELAQALSHMLGKG